jgi:hypothetical protein
MSVSHLTCFLLFLLLLTGCRERQAAVPPQPASAPDPTMHQYHTMDQYQRLAADAERLEFEADVLLTVDGTLSERAVRLVRPKLSGFTNDLTTLADFKSLAGALRKHDSAVIQLWAVGWDTNRVTNAVSLLRQAGFRSIRATAMRWGQSTAGPELWRRRLTSAME